MGCQIRWVIIHRIPWIGHSVFDVCLAHLIFLNWWIGISVKQLHVNTNWGKLVLQKKIVTDSFLPGSSVRRRRRTGRLTRTRTANRKATFCPTPSTSSSPFKNLSQSFRSLQEQRFESRDWRFQIFFSRPNGNTFFLVAVPRTRLAGLQSTVTALPCTAY